MEDRLAALADAQQGIFSTADAASVGVSPAALKGRVRTGRYERVGTSTYRVVGAPPSWRQSVMRAVTAAGDGAAASHRTALALHRVVRPDRTVDVLVPRRRRLHAAGIRLHTTTALPAEDLRLVTGIRTTSIERSMLDFAGDAHPDALAYAIDVAVRMELTTVDLLAGFLERRRRRGRPGVAALERALDREWLGIAESRYERGLLAMLEEAGLGGVPQYDILDDDGSFIARVDVAWPLQRVALEVDGHAFHATRDQREHDAVRQNRILVARWNLLRCTSDQVHRRDRSITTMVTRALRAADRRG